MYKISAQTCFSAAHRIVGYDGPCGKAHGHNWRVRVEVRTRDLDALGIGYDFKDLKVLLGEATARLDHEMLNEIPPFDTMNPTAENIARQIHDLMKSRIPEKVEIVHVEVWESSSYKVTYSEE